MPVREMVWDPPGGRSQALTVTVDGPDALSRQFVRAVQAALTGNDNGERATFLTNIGDKSILFRVNEDS